MYFNNIGRSTYCCVKSVAKLNVLFIGQLLTHGFYFINIRIIGHNKIK